MEDAGQYRIKCVNRVGATVRDSNLLNFTQILLNFIQILFKFYSILLKFIFSASLAIVTEPPAFTTPLNDVTTQLGTTSSFEAVVTGTPRPEVAWFRDGSELKKGKRVLFEEEPNPEGGFKYRVTIRDIVMKDFGQVITLICFIQHI